MTAMAPCRTCGTAPLESARFCHGCGSPVKDVDARAEYKQVTVLFADVVHSMDIAAAVGPERLREVMADIADHCAAVVGRFGGTVDKFTGDGIMAVFGAPIALEDHAIRACHAALGIQQEAKRLAADVHERDGVDLQLRVGLNSGQVIAGEIGSGPFGYTAIGEQVGLAQRMESAAPPGGVMLSTSTARLVEGLANLGEFELVRIKGADAPVGARRLLGLGEEPLPSARAESKLVGRRQEMSAVENLLGLAIDGDGAVVTVVGPPGIGKSRIVRELVAVAAARGVDVFSAFCESHTSGIPFHVVARLLRRITGVKGLEPDVARARIRAQSPDAEPEDVLLFDDLLGIADPDVPPPKIDPDARRRRLTALVNAALTAHDSHTLYVIEDAHWIDEVSESMLADVFAVIRQTASLVVITYRPEYRGGLSNGTQTIALAPLSDRETATLATELLGTDPSIVGINALITDKAAGNPFFVEEMVRDLAERGVLDGDRGDFRCAIDVADVKVPATLQATLAARIDRLDPAAKRTLNAAAVIGARLDAELLVSLIGSAEVDALIEAQLVDPATVGSRAGYAFRHPLIRAVAYESQLKSDRAELHRRLADVLQQQHSGPADDVAALVAEHLESAGDLAGAYGWHMRAGSWLMGRDVAAARSSWERARNVADALPSGFPDQISLRILPRTLLCSTAWRVGSTADEAGFGELRALCTASGNRVSLAAGLSGAMLSLTMANRHHDAARLASEQIALFDSADDRMSMFGVMSAAMFAKLHAGEAAEALRVAQAVTDLMADDGSTGNLMGWGLGSPLAVALLYRAQARAALGDSSWRADLRRALAIQRDFGERGIVIVVTYGYSLSVTNGLLVADAAALAETAAVLRDAEKSGDASALALAQVTHGLVMTRAEAADHQAGAQLLLTGRKAQQVQRNLLSVAIVDIRTALLKAEAGEFDDAIAIARATVNELTGSGEMVIRAAAVAALVTALLGRGGDAEVYEAQAMVDRLAAVPTEPGFVLNEIWLLRMRALLARAHSDQNSYRDYLSRYRSMAKSLGFEGHLHWADAMT
ncbi:adenylate/guanylate cyclase domain-containing protein [Mycobacterium sp. 050128]|uniref:ATP-binding protein n=1 Tax=Mycobacterium sp. 050128 TaxID=3096112 RepID=UPI002EDA3F79